ncbi:MAG: hypothetical protein HUJ58_07205 [Erysipelotrichaceae bacterium]|nr:hypothetical protein [Erysipelotrichaceae bacterium]
MNINIRVKGVSNRENKIQTITYTYPDGEYTVDRFLRETVRINLEEYQKISRETIPGKDYYDRSENSRKVLQVLSFEEIENQATGGKVSFGVVYGDSEVDLKNAQDNAIQCFEDGMVALFADGNRYEEIKEILPLQENSEVIFVRLTFLAGRMW